ncbi:MAG: hypothetical protein ACK4UU_07270, partial [Fimbriimonadales bacterium]
GISLEEKYRNQARSYFSRLLKNAQVVHFPEIEERLAPDRPLTDQERDDLIETDLFVVGIDRDTGDEIVLAVEVSWTVDLTDIERAVRRAQIIAAHGAPAAAVAAGRELAADAHTEAHQRGCGIMLGGQLQLKPSLITTA